MKRYYRHKPAPAAPQYDPWGARLTQRMVYQLTHDFVRFVGGGVPPFERELIARLELQRQTSGGGVRALVLSERNDIELLLIMYVRYVSIRRDIAQPCAIVTPLLSATAMLHKSPYFRCFSARTPDKPRMLAPYGSVLMLRSDGYGVHTSCDANARRAYASLLGSIDDRPDTIFIITGTSLRRRGRLFTQLYRRAARDELPSDTRRRRRDNSGYRPNEGTPGWMAIDADHLSEVPAVEPEHRPPVPPEPLNIVDLYSRPTGRRVRPRPTPVPTPVTSPMNTLC